MMRSVAQVVILSGFVAQMLPSAIAFHQATPTLSVFSFLSRQSTAASAYAAGFDLFDGEEDEMFPIAENFVHAKYKQYAQANGKDVCSKTDIANLLKSLLPPVTPSELQEEVDKTLQIIMENPKNAEDNINEDSFVKAIVQNTYWRNAGSLVVKELMLFDSLYAYYQTGKSLLNNDDYGELKENLTWEGSSVATMNRQECMFVNAVAASKRGEPILSDEEYQELKTDLKTQGSWVVSRGQDALEKLGLDTFLGYLHRSLK
jgi:hypothetical protein